MLGRAQQVAVLFQLALRYADKRNKAIGVELCQLSRINTVRLDLFVARDGNTGRRINITMKAF
jgi:hypothetical protein